MAGNKLEACILRAVAKAHAEYLGRTDGWQWLFHAPESFLQHEIAREIYRKEDRRVFTEASPAKIARELEKPGRGRPPKNLRKRFDVVVWSKTIEHPRAIIELKRTFNAAEVVKDATKLKDHFKYKRSFGTGYLVWYTEAKGATAPKREKKIHHQFSILSKNVRGWKKVDHLVRSPRDNDGAKGSKWSWGVCLLRYR
jgi:hypothetical protein